MVHTWTGSVSRDVLERVSYVLGIFKALEILLPRADSADGWIRRPNDAPPFGGRSALDRMLSGNVADLYAVRQYLDATRGRRWVQAMEIRPTAVQQTHHVLVFIEEPGRSARRAPGEPAPQGGIDGFFAGTAPGGVGISYPEGMAKRLPAGAWLKFQVHYTTNGTAAVDRSRLGLVFADAPPRTEVRTSSAFNTRFVIPAGAPKHEVVGEHRFRQDAMILNFFPHMHNRGAAFRYELIAGDAGDGDAVGSGDVAGETLLEIPRYDFNWQLVYTPRQPVFAPAGSMLRATGWFDNSHANPGNPDPTADVRFGEQTWEEMMIGYFDWIPARGAANE